MEPTNWGHLRLSLLRRIPYTEARVPFSKAVLLYSGIGDDLECPLFRGVHYSKAVLYSLIYQRQVSSDNIEKCPLIGAFFLRGSTVEIFPELVFFLYSYILSIPS